MTQNHEPTTGDRQELAPGEICEDCGKAIGDSLSYWQCQECWEEVCSQSWWEVLEAIERQGVE